MIEDDVQEMIFRKHFFSVEMNELDAIYKNSGQMFVIQCILLNIIYMYQFSKLFCLDAAQGRMHGAPYETRAHTRRFDNLACYPLHHPKCLYIQHSICPLDWGCRIHRLHQSTGVRTTPNKYSEYDPKQSDGEILGMRSTPSLPLLPCPHGPGVVASDRVISNRTKMNSCKTELLEIGLF